MEPIYELGDPRNQLSSTPWEQLSNTSNSVLSDQVPVPVKHPNLPRLPTLQQNVELRDKEVSPCWRKYLKLAKP
jgi:hypothetical protein